MSNVEDIAQRIAATACAALQDLRDGKAFPRDAYLQIELDLKAIARAREGQSPPITEADVIAIRSDERPYHKIAKARGISQGTVWKIKNRLTWKHVGAPA